MEATAKNNYNFLKGGGELGALTRDFDWSQTPVGSPDTWPQSLRLTVSMILKSKFPMFLWWGDDLVQFYNDAYRPSLGNNGKHPTALGQKGKDCWPEIWEIIYPLITQVRTTGEATWSEDQLIPIYRNGKIEDVYWTFGYSPIEGESGNVEGVLVVCTETTEKVQSSKKLEESKKQFQESEQNLRNILLQAPVGMTLMKGPDFKVHLTNERALQLRGRTLEEVIGKPIFDAVPEARNQGFYELLKKVYDTGEPYSGYGKPLSIKRNGKMENIYVSFTYKPYRETDGTISGIMSVITDVTSEIISRQKLEESEQRFRTMSEGSEILIATSDETGNVTYLNKAWTEFTGRSMNELLNYGWADLIHEEDRQAFLDIYLSAFKKQEPWVGEFRMLNKDNEYRWLMVRGPVRLNADKSFAGYISSSIDITDSKMAEKALRESEQEIRSLVENAPFPIGVYKGREMRIALANKSIMDVWGKGTDVIGKLYREILPELDKQEVFKQLDEVYRTGVPFHIKNQPLDLVVDGKAQKFYFNYSLTPLFDTSGKVYGVMNTGVDLTDLNTAKQKIEQSERNFRAMVLQAPVAMCILLGPSHIIEVANELMIEIWGKPKNDVLNKPVFEALPDARNQGLEQLMVDVYVNGVTFKADERPVELLRKGKKETVYQNFVYEPYRASDGTILGILAISIDVTAQVLARQKIEEIVAERTKELAEANNNLQKSNAELAQFAYIASHDLQEPLRKIGTFSQMLERSLGNKIPEQSKNYLHKINNSSSRMNSLIRDVLAYSELVKSDDQFVRVDLNNILQNAIADYDLLIEQTGARIESGELPVIEAIPLQMAQLFGNLMGNALKFIRKNATPQITISAVKLTQEEKEAFSLDKTRDYFRIRFADNGVGILPEFTEQIFHIFQRLHRKSEFAGTGIGLAMCKKIALNHNGDIHAADSSEKGAVFTIFLPATQVKK